MLVDRKCLVCDSPASGMREYCSDDCYHERKRFMRRNKHPAPTCLMCSKEFVRSGNRQKVCVDCRPKKTRLYTEQYNSIFQEEVNKRRREGMKKERLKNPEKFRERDRKWQEANRDAVNERRRTPERRAKANLLQKEKSATPRGRAHSRMASAIYQALKHKKAGRKWETLVGYTHDDLVRHLERQFVDGMSWDNAGKWHIDHIIPKSSFKYESAECDEFKACWALTNLRPLWAGENMRKHSKRELLL